MSFAYTTSSPEEFEAALRELSDRDLRRALVLNLHIAEILAVPNPGDMATIRAEFERRGLPFPEREISENTRFDPRA